MKALEVYFKRKQYDRRYIKLLDITFKKYFLLLSYITAE